jgi:glycosyltransferase involved in cell wall biosynthesis
LNRRVLVLTGSYYPDVGGGEALNARHVALLVRGDFDVRVLVAGGTGAGIDAFGNRYEPVERWNAGGYGLIPPERMRREIERFDPALVYLLGPNPHDAYALRIAARRRVPAALLYHADFRSDRAISRMATHAYGALAGKHAARVCVTTRAYERRLCERGYDPRRIAYVGMGVDETFFTPPAAYDGAPAKRLLFVGRLDANHTYKRLDLLIEAVAHLRSRGDAAYRLTVVGDGDRRAEFESATAASGMSEAVKFAGQVDDAGLREAYRQADLLVLPSPTASEGFGMVVLEALACGTPVVTHRAAGGSEVVAASGCGAVWEGEGAGDLAAAIERASADPRSRGDVASAARAFVEAEYGWEAVGARLRAVASALIEASAE